MVKNSGLLIKKAKRLAKGQRTHMRRLKQAARKDPTINVQPHN